MAFLTAYIAVVEIAKLSAGQKVLIHAGAGGVGHAAIQIARHLGAQVYATGNPDEHAVLHRLGVAHHHIASSRTLDFVGTFGDVTQGHGMDVVLNSLAGEFIDASLDLVARGGCLVEIGKTDIRSATAIAASHPGVVYHPYDLATAAPDHLRRTWAALSELFSAAILQPLPTTSYSLFRLSAPSAI